MTDKEKIREEVERLKLYTMDEHMKSYSECAEAEYNALCKVKEQVKESVETQHVNKTCKENDNSLTQVHASEDLENAAIEICSKVLTGETINIDGYEYVVLSDAEECFKAGANWQKEQFEKNRLTVCDKQTEGEAKIESDFVMGIIENEPLTKYWNGAQGKVTHEELTEHIKQRKHLNKVNLYLK